MPNKLTDTEIKKALECCDGSFDKCGECPLDNVIQDKLRCWELEKSALDLINRQEEENKSLQAEIERLKKETKKCKEHYKMACSERNEFLEQLQTAKAEAYKECIEKAKSELKNISKFDFHGTLYYMVGEAFFDNLLNELVGDKNGKDL